MSISADTLRKLAALNLSSEQMTGVLQLLADTVEKDEKRKAEQAERKRRSRDGHRTVTATPSLDGFPDLSLNPSKENPPKGGQKKVSPEEMASFWKIYPKTRAGSREKAEAELNKALRRATLEEIMAGVTAYALSDEVAKGMGKGCAGWLRDDRWTTDYRPRSRPPPQTGFGRAAL